jgi:hypothetical protein
MVTRSGAGEVYLGEAYVACGLKALLGRRVIVKTVFVG